MSEESTPKKSLLSKAREMADSVLDAQIMKAKNSMLINQKTDVEDFIFGKAVVEDPNYAVHAAGWKEKPSRLLDTHLKQIARSDSVIAAIIQTRQNQASNFSRYVSSEAERGWMLKLRNEEELLEEIKMEIRGGLEEAPIDEVDENDNIVENVASEDDDEKESHDWELERQAKAKLNEQYKDARNKLKEHITCCGKLPDGHEKPFAYSKWNFDSTIRAWVRDTLTYDKYATEIVPNADGSVAYFFPVDASTIKYSSNRFKDQKALAENFNNLNLFYSDTEAEGIEESKVLELDEELLEADAYKWVQVVLGKIERAYTDDELKVGIRNYTTDIFQNGYGISELELLIALVTGHLNAEFYNQAYFTQGFSAKGILHIKAALNRRKLETVRQQWSHMLKGARNSFQTPIFAGVDEVEWIPLTQNHDDIGFEGWMRYLVKMMCSVYQIDPMEMGLPFKEEGGSGAGGMAGDSTREKMEHSKDKGLYPLMRHIENYINENIIPLFDDRFILCFTGLGTETDEEAQKRRAEEVKFLKTVNEVREEAGLPPLPGMDDIILDTVYMQWYQTFSEAGKANQEAMMGGGMGMGAEGAPMEEEEEDTSWDFSGSNFSDTDNESEEEYDFSKALKIEYYTVSE